MRPPLDIVVSRGPSVESRHAVHAVVVDGSASTTWGDGDLRVLPRSAVKMIQALPLVTSGAADAFGLGPRELALACASHAGEDEHVAAVRDWLTRIGAHPGDLECGVQLGRLDSAVANNCSGKHTGFLTVARHLGVDPARYLDPTHPVQHGVTAALQETLGVDLAPERAGIDGCGIPTHPVPLASLATGLARFALADADAPRRLSDAMRREPFLVGGTGHLDTRLIEAVPGLITKTGAEGVYVAAHLEREFAVAVKAVDGAHRAAAAGLLFLLHHHGLAVDRLLLTELELHNWSGTKTGGINVSSPEPS